MEELKQALRNELKHVTVVHFDKHDNWYLHKVPSSVKTMTREEILGEVKEVVSPEVETEIVSEGGKKKNKK
jgi:hypothetical protein